MTVHFWTPEVAALADDVVQVAHGRQAALAAVGVSVPDGTDPTSFAQALKRSLRKRGLSAVHVVAHPGAGPASLLSVEFSR